MAYQIVWDLAILSAMLGLASFTGGCLISTYEEIRLMFEENEYSEKADKRWKWIKWSGVLVGLSLPFFVMFFLLGGISGLLK